MPEASGPWFVFEEGIGFERILLWNAWLKSSRAIFHPKSALLLLVKCIENVVHSFSAYLQMCRKDPFCHLMWWHWFCENQGCLKNYIISYSAFVSFSTERL